MVAAELRVSRASHRIAGVFWRVLVRVVIHGVIRGYVEYLLMLFGLEELLLLIDHVATAAAIAVVARI